jgi:hypothetical protein
MRGALLFALVACSPEIPEGVLLCGPSDPCPPGFYCRSSGTCYGTPESDASAGIDGAIRVDGGPPAACESDPECEDGDPCTLNDCKDRACDTTPAREGDPCGDGASRCCGGRCIQANTGAACGVACEICELNEICLDGVRCECADGFDDCDPGVTGCETNVKTDAMHCGGCTRACASTKSCIDGMCSTCVMPADCDDGQECTEDQCVGGRCVRTPRSGTCNDGNACTLMDTCTAVGTCSGTARTCSDDGNPCTSDTCNPADGSCNTLPTGSAFCIDSDACTSGDTCVGTMCMGTSYECPDSIDPPLNCSQPFCNGTGGCPEFPLSNGSACQDRAGTSRHVCWDNRCVDLDSVCCSPGTESGACCSGTPDPTDHGACMGMGRCVGGCC